VAFFDSLHDMGDPVGVASHVKSTLKSRGTWMIVEPYAGIDWRTISIRSAVYSIQHQHNFACPRHCRRKSVWRSALKPVKPDYEK